MCWCICAINNAAVSPISIEIEILGSRAVIDSNHNVAKIHVATAEGNMSTYLARARERGRGYRSYPLNHHFRIIVTLTPLRTHARVHLTPTHIALIMYVKFMRVHFFQQ